MQQVYKIIVIVEWTKIEIKFGGKSWGFNWCLSWIRLQLDCNRTAGVKYSVFTTIATGGDKEDTQLLLRPSYVLKVLHIDQSGLPYCSLWSSFLAQPVKIWSNRMTEDTQTPLWNVVPVCYQIYKTPQVPAHLSNSFLATSSLKPYSVPYNSRICCPSEE